MNNRSKGLSWCREVKGILEGLGHIVEGPGYSIAFYQGRMNPIHKDYFGVWDLVSFKDGNYYFHQISDITNKSKKIKAIQGLGMNGQVWCRVNEENKVGYRVFFVRVDSVKEGEVVFKGRKI